MIETEKRLPAQDFGFQFRTKRFVLGTFSDKPDRVPGVPQVPWGASSRICARSRAPSSPTPVDLSSGEDATIMSFSSIRRPVRRALIGNRAWPCSRPVWRRSRHPIACAWWPSIRKSNRLPMVSLHRSRRKCRRKSARRPDTASEWLAVGTIHCLAGASDWYGGLVFAEARRWAPRPLQSLPVERFARNPKKLDGPETARAGRRSKTADAIA